MNQDLQNLEIKVENDGATPQGRLTATEWNILVAAVKSLDLTGGSADAASILQVVANAGYATQSWVTSQKYITSLALDNLAKNLVMLDTTQAITGMKDFTNGLKIGGVSVYKSKEGIVFVDGNLAVRGAITMYADNGQAAPSIWDEFPYDDETIKRNAAGKFYAVGGGGSGTGGLDSEMLDDYLTTNGYATQSWVTGRGYLTGITGAMVTNALGYTPLSTSGGTITGEVTITAAANSPLKINSTATDSVIYFNHNGVSKTWVGFEASRGSVLYHSGGSHRLGINNDGVAFYDSNTLLHSGNYSKYALPITGGTVNGAVTINHNGNTPLVINQNYGTASNPRGVVVMNSTLSNSNLYISHLFGKEGSMRNSAWVGFYLDSAGSNNNRLSMGLYGVDNVLNILGNGNVAIGGTTASEKLHVYGNLGLEGCLKVVKSTYPDIRGNGSYLTLSPDDVAGSKGSVGLYKTGDSSYEFRRVWDHYSYGSMNLGSSGNRWTTVYGVAADFSGNIVGNNILAKGAITMYYSSDERLKQNIREVNASKVLMSLGGVYQYEYIDSEVARNSTYGGSHYGLIYQNVKGSALDKMCFEREDGYGALNYLDTNFISLIVGATMENISEVEKLKKENKALRKRVEQLEKRVA